MIELWEAEQDRLEAEKERVAQEQSQQAADTQEQADGEVVATINITPAE